jgi:Golgi phosphoprotein 3
MLTLAEEMLLLALDEETGTIVDLPNYQTNAMLVAAVLMDLALQNRIDTDLQNLQVISQEPTQNPILDKILDLLPVPGQTQSIRTLLDQLSEQGEDIRELALGQLIEKRILKQEDRRLLWVFKTRRYPMIDNREIKEVEGRLHDLITGDDLPDPRDVVLISLVNICGLFDQILSPREWRRNQARIAQLSKMDLIGQQLSKSIQEIQRALAMSGLPG